MVARSESNRTVASAHCLCSRMFHKISDPGNGCLMQRYKLKSVFAPYFLSPTDSFTPLNNRTTSTSTWKTTASLQGHNQNDV